MSQYFLTYDLRKHFYGGKIKIHFIKSKFNFVPFCCNLQQYLALKKQHLNELFNYVTYSLMSNQSMKSDYCTHEEMNGIRKNYLILTLQRWGVMNTLDRCLTTEKAQFRTSLACSSNLNYHY